MTTNKNFRVKNGLEVGADGIKFADNTVMTTAASGTGASTNTYETIVLGGITLANNSGTLTTEINTPGSTTTLANSSIVALIVDIAADGIADAMNSYNGATPGVNGSPTYSTDQIKFDDYSWNNESNTNNFIQAYSSDGYDFSAMGSSNNWTIDLWIYTKSGASGSGYQTLVNGSYFGDGPNNIWFGVDNGVPLSGTLRAGNGGSNDIVGPQMPGTEEWHHVGLMRQDGTLYFLLNGTTTPASSNSTLSFGNGLEFLGGSTNSPFGLGYASGIRVSRNTALFSVGTYTLPIAADYDPAGGIEISVVATTVNASIEVNTATVSKIVFGDATFQTTAATAYTPPQALGTYDSPRFDTVISRFIDSPDSNGGHNYSYLDINSSNIGYNANTHEFWDDQHRSKLLEITSAGITFSDNSVQNTAATGFIGTTSTANITDTLTVAGIDLQSVTTGTLKFSYSETGEGDAFTNSVSVLARGTDLLDLSTNNYTILAQGSAVAGSTGENNLQVGSFYSPGTTSDFIYIGAYNINYGSNPFAIDFWVYTDDDATAGVKTMASQWNNPWSGSWIIQGGADSNEYYALILANGDQFVYFTITPGQWNHIAVVRQDLNTLKVYVNGVLDDTNTNIDGNLGSGSNDIRLFVSGDGLQQPFAGYIEDFRVTLAARYTDAFTPPASANDYTLATLVATTASIQVASIEFADGTSMSTAATGGGGGVSNYSRLDLPTVTTGTIVLISDSSNDAQSPIIKNSVPAYYDTTDSIWRYISNNQQVIETIVTAPASFDYLIVAGGGGGGSGGGGAGGMLTGTNALSISELYTVTVGAGGARTSSANKGVDGSNSSINSIVAIGGGGGPDVGQNNAGAGGSGAGAAQTDSGTVGGAGTTGQGNAGGDSVAAGWPYPGAGGGGAGEVGGSADGVTPGDGGDGLQSDITGTLTYYAGGGGGAFNQPGATSGAGGLGGGGVGSIAGQTLAVDGVVNTGGGGGAGGVATNGGNGGSGIVVIRFEDTADWPTFLTGTYSTSTYTGYKVISFTGSGTFKY